MGLVPLPHGSWVGGAGGRGSIRLELPRHKQFSWPDLGDARVPDSEVGGAVEHSEFGGDFIF